MRRRLWLLVGMCLLQAPLPTAHAQTTYATEAAAQSDEAFALRLADLLRDKNYAEALSLLQGRPDVLSRPDGLKLEVQLLMELGREDEALSRIEAYLSAHPQDSIARFQLGELRYRRGEDQAAALAYRLAIAGGLDPLRLKIVQTRLEGISGRKAWRVWAGAAIAPDSNFNSATDAGFVEIFGLPFALDADARRRAGVGLQAYAGLEHTKRISPNLALKASASGSFSDFSGRIADVGVLSLRAGIERRFQRTQTISLHVTRGFRWFGGRLIETGAGLSGELDLYARNRRWTTSVDTERVTSHIGEGRDGWRHNLSVNRTHYLSNSSLWRARVALGRRDVNLATESYWQGQAAVGRLVSLPAAVSLFAEASVTERRFDAANFAFGVKREDRDTTLELRFTKRNWVVMGAQPYLSAVTSKTTSNLPLFSYSRNRIEIGFTREF